MSTNLELPANFTMEVVLTDGSNKTATMEVTLPSGKYPTKKNIQEAIEMVKTKISDEGFVLCDRHEFASHMIKQITGEHGAVAGMPKEWAAPYTA